MDKASESNNQLNKISLFFCVITLIFSVTALIGWLFGFLLIASVSKTFIPMAPSTAIFFIILCGAFLIHLRLTDRYVARLVSRILGLFIVIGSLVIFVDYSNNSIIWDPEGMIPFKSTHFGGVLSGRMSPITSGNFLLAGLSFLLLTAFSRKTRFFLMASVFLATAVSTSGLVLFVGYLHGTPLLYGGTIIPVALPTAIAFLSLGVGLCLAAGPDFFPQRLFLGTSIRSRLMRAFFPLTVGIILIHGFLYSYFFSNTSNPSLISSLMTIFSLTVVGIIVSIISKTISIEIDVIEAVRSQAEKTLKSSEKKYRMLVETLQEGIWAIDKNNTTTFINNRLAVMLGYTPEEMIGESPYSFMDEQGVKLFQRNLERQRQGIDELQEFELITKSGTQIYTTMRIGPINDDEGNYLGLLAGVTDISERKRLQDEVMVKVAQLESALATVKQLEGIIPICSYCKKIRDDKESWHQLEHYISDHSEAVFSHGICPGCLAEVKKTYESFVN